MDNNVPERMKCPNCKEQDADQLLLNEDDQVKCLTCDTEYDISNLDNVVILPKGTVKG